MSGQGFTRGELADADRAVTALLRARNDGRDADMSAIVTTMTARELQPVALMLVAIAHESVGRMCGLRLLASDQAAVDVVWDTPLSEMMSPEGRELVARMLASVHEGMIEGG